MTDDPDIDEAALAFFNKLSGRLKIELTEEAQRVAPHMLNLAAAPTAQLKSVRFELARFEPDAAQPGQAPEDEAGEMVLSMGGQFHALTDEELNRVVVRVRSITMVSGETDDAPITHAAPDGRAFRVRDLAACVEETERQARGRSQWLGGIDVHHIFFEGISRQRDGTWFIAWGS